jgi:hypothetical protein
MRKILYTSYYIEAQQHSNDALEQSIKSQEGNEYLALSVEGIEDVRQLVDILSNPVGS